MVFKVEWPSLRLLEMLPFLLPSPGFELSSIKKFPSGRIARDTDMCQGEGAVLGMSEYEFTL